MFFKVSPWTRTYWKDQICLVTSPALFCVSERTSLHYPQILNRCWCRSKYILKIKNFCVFSGLMMVALIHMSTQAVFLALSTRLALHHMHWEKQLLTIVNSFQMSSNTLNALNMDDFSVATYSIEKAQRILREMRATLSRRGFNLAKWNSNSSEFLETLEPGIKLHSSKIQPQNQKVLGLPWNPITDCYMIETNSSENSNWMRT